MLRGAAATHLRRHIITQRRRIATPESIRAVAVDPSGALTPRAVDLATLRKTTGAPLRDLLHLGLDGGERDAGRRHRRLRRRSNVR